MEVDNVAVSEKKEIKYIDSGQGQTHVSVPESSIPEDDESMRLDPNHGKLNGAEMKPNTINLPSMIPSFKDSFWSYDSSVCQFGTKKFQRNGSNLIFPAPSDYQNKISGSDSRLKEAAISNFSKPMLVDETADVISPSGCPDDFEVKQTLTEVLSTIKSGDSVFSDPPESFTKVNEANSPSKRSDHIIMERNLVESKPNEDNGLRNYLGSLSKDSKKLLSRESSNDFDILQHSVKMVSKEDNELENPLEFITPTNQAISTRQCLDGIERQQTSYEAMSSEDSGLNNLTGKFCEFSVAISPTACIYETGLQKQSTNQLLNDVKMKKNTLKSRSRSFEDRRTNLASYREKIHQEKSTKLIDRGAKVEVLVHPSKSKHVYFSMHSVPWLLQ